MNAPSSSSDRDPLERLAAEFLERRRRGENPALSEYAERYPQWAEQIREFFPALEVMEGLKPGSGSETGLISDRPDGAGAPLLERLGEYRILREIGRGGMGVVYEAIQESLGRRVALKTLPFHGRIDAVQMERFQLESRSAARLHHTSIVPVHGVGEHLGVHYYVMQYIQGHGLDVILDDLRRLQAGAAAMPASASRQVKNDTGSVAIARSLLTGRFAGSASTRHDQLRAEATNATDDKLAAAASVSAPSLTLPTDGSGISSVLSQPTESGYYRAVARLGVQVADALAHAHGQGVLHRDIKPSNLLLDVDGHVWITDFGLAKLEGSDGPTHTGDIVGTLRYMAPERFEGWSDRRSDIYGLGMTLYELLTLRPAFESATRARLIDQVIHDTPTAPRKHDPRIPRDLETIVLKAIAKEPAERYGTAEAIASDLENFLADRPIVARRSGAIETAWRWCRRNKAAAGLLAASAAAGLALVGVAVGLFYNRQLQAKNTQLVTASERLNAARVSEERIGYFKNMLLAEREWFNNNVGRAEPLLDQCVPEPGHADLRGWEWQYLKRQCHTELKTIPVLPTQVMTQAMGVAFSADDRHIATTGYDDKTVRIWNSETGDLEQTLHDLVASQWMFSEGLAYSPDGKLLAAACGSAILPGKAVVWDTATWERRREFKDVCGESNCVAFSPDSRRLAVVTGETFGGQGRKRPRLRIWEMKTGEKIEIEGDEGEMAWISVAFSPDGNSIATASGKLDQESTQYDAGAVKIWNSRTGIRVRTLPHPAPLTCVAWSPNPDRPWVATASHDKTLKIWDVNTGGEIRTLSGHTQVSFKVAFSPAGDRLASVSDDNSAKIWDAATGRELFTLRGHTREVHGVAFSHDGQRLATTSMDGTVKIWDAETGRNAVTLPGRPGSWVMALSFSPDGQRIASGGLDNRVTISDAVNGKQLRPFKELTHPVWVLAYSPDGHALATGSGHWNEPKKPGLITLWNAETGEETRRIFAHAGLIRKLAFSPDSRRLASAGGEHHTDLPDVPIWDTTTGKEIGRCTGHLIAPYALAYSRDGRLLASAGWDNLLIIWDAWSGTPLRSITFNDVVIWDLAFSPEGTRLASAAFDGTVQVRDVATGAELFRFSGHKSAAWCVAFSPDGNRAASGAEDGTVKVWDAKTGEEALTLRGHSDAVLRVAFSPDGSRIASASKDGTVKIWDGSPYIESATTRSQPPQTNATR
jgi:WD40 repeat protein/serine/threonine protein kinase